MKLEEVLPALREGKKIRRNSWWNGHYFQLISNGIVNQEGKYFALGKDDIICNDWEIVKEKKKVKLRDLTLEQYEKWVSKNCGYATCNDCVFNSVNCGGVSAYCWVKDKSLFSDKFLDQEIEIEE